MKRAMSMSSIFCAATTLLVVICCLGPGLSQAHYYDDYAIQKSATERMLDGSLVTLFSLANLNASEVRRSQTEKCIAIIMVKHVWIADFLIMSELYLIRVAVLL